MKLAIWIFSILILALSQSVFAGDRGSGGGVVWQCADGKTYLADDAEFEMLHPPGRRFVGFAETSDSKPNILDFIVSGNLNFIAERLNIANPGVGDAMVARAHELKFQPTKDPLPLLNDDQLPLETVINGQKCTKAQLAIQYFATGVVTYNEDIFNALSVADAWLFQAHESLVSLQERPLGSTVPIRAEILKAVIGNMLDSLAGSAVFPGFHGKVSSTFKNFHVELSVGGCSFRGSLAGAKASIDENGNYAFPPTPYNLYDKNPDEEDVEDDGKICVKVDIFDQNHNRIEKLNDNRIKGAGQGSLFFSFDESHVPSAAEVQSAIDSIK